MPNKRRCVTLLHEDRPVTSGGLVNHCNIVCSSFIMLDIATIYKVKLSVVHQLSNQVFGGISLFTPPASKERLQSMHNKVGHGSMVRGLVHRHG